MHDFWKPFLAIAPDRSRRFQITPRQWRQSLLALGLTTAVWVGVWTPRLVQAASPESAPGPLKTLLTQIDAAANGQKLQDVLQFYSPSFSSADGITRQTLEQALTQLWQRYPNIRYQTEIKSWKPEGRGFSVETITSITGTQKEGDREWQLLATIESRQQIENQKIVRQEILSERSQIASGKNPPTVKINLPERVKPGQEFAFDAIVQEPLGNDILLGTAIEESVRPDGFLKPTTANLEVLPAGGLFKVARAPKQPENRWLSAVVVRQDGITMITQRLKVTASN